LLRSPEAVLAKLKKPSALRFAGGDEAKKQSKAGRSPIKKQASKDIYHTNLIKPKTKRLFT
jgi:hypothetical protein